MNLKVNTMKLKPVIASYSGETFSAIRQCLTDDVLEVVASIAQSPQKRTDIPSTVLSDLINMHVCTEERQMVRLHTAVFLQDDITRIVTAIQPVAEGLSRRILACGAAFQQASPEITIFLAGIIGFGQGLGSLLSQKQIGTERKDYAGKYARSKVDFDESCPAYETLGPDTLNKSVLHGDRYTAVSIGPGGDNFCSWLSAGTDSERKRHYVNALNTYLVDAYAQLVTGERSHPSLRAAAEMANLSRQGTWRTAIITNTTIQPYETAIHAILETTSAYYAEHLGFFETLLHTTTAGRQGVSPSHMMMHLWRYIRKVSARTLYDAGFFTDTIPEHGAVTIFYENDVTLLRQLLC